MSDIFEIEEVIDEMIGMEKGTVIQVSDIAKIVDCPLHEVLDYLLFMQKAIKIDFFGQSISCPKCQSTEVCSITFQVVNDSIHAERMCSCQHSYFASNIALYVSPNESYRAYVLNRDRMLSKPRLSMLRKQV